MGRMITVDFQVRGSNLTEGPSLPEPTSSERPTSGSYPERVTASLPTGLVQCDNTDS